MTRVWSGAAPAARRSPLALAVRQALLVLGLSVIVAAGRWAWPGPRLALHADRADYEIELAAPLLDVATAKRHYDAGVHLFIDTREPGPAVTERVPGAFFIRPDTFDDDMRALLDVIVPEDRFILYGDGNLALANNVAARLIQRGYANVELLKGGLAAWRAAGGPVSPLAAPGTP
jgi:rhodanese-related sulfurtransferase